MSHRRLFEELLLLFVFLGVFVWSALSPADRFTWWLEISPALIGVPLLIVTRSRFRFTLLVYTLICMQAILLLVGGHYTYAHVPLFNWLRDYFHLSRNHFDRLGHFMQGLVPALMARELLLRTSPLKRGKWLIVIIFGLCMGISSMYELFEWRVAVATGSRADEFLGTQGDPWDTQEDMAMCGVGALTALIALTRLHDAQLGDANAVQPRSHEEHEAISGVPSPRT